MIEYALNETENKLEDIREAANTAVRSCIGAYLGGYKTRYEEKKREYESIKKELEYLENKLRCLKNIQCWIKEGKHEEAWNVFNNFFKPE